MRSLLTAAAIFAMATGAALPQQAGDAAGGLVQWDKIYAVLSHPRCANCHVEDDRPRWSGAHYGATRAHGFDVRRGADGSGFGNPCLC